ncbi:MAG: PTS sugar transporter subunit IIA [Betaproteobacteria bacterium]|nr:PTS sugar transporter subunit IIA [Betaproteobacteria bacterium]
MNRIAALLDVHRIALDVRSDSKADLFSWLGQRFAGDLGLAPQVVSASLRAREDLGSTALGQGMAIPHGRLKGLKTAAGVLVRLQTGLEFSAPDTVPVRLLFVLFVPVHATDEHLQILGELAQLFGDRDMRERLLGCRDEHEVLECIRDWRAE